MFLGVIEKIRIRWSNLTALLRKARDESRRERVSYTPDPVPLVYEPEVLVVGGGVSGFAAAVAAARTGARTLMVEKQGTVGGLVTAGLVSPFSMQVIMPSGEVVTRGLVEELFDRLVKVDGIVREWRDWRIPKLPVDPEAFKLVAIEMLQEAGVEILFNTLFSDVEHRDGQISYLIVRNKSGLHAIQPKVVIDCTGEADVARATGVPCTLNADVDPSVIKVVSQALKKKGWVQRTEKTSSLQFMIGSVDLDRTHDFIVSHPETYASTTRGELVEDVELFTYLWKERGFFYLPHQTSFKELINSAKERGDFQPKIGRYVLIDESGIGMDGLRGHNTVIVNANRVMLNPFDEEDVTDALMEGQRVCFAIWSFLRDHIPGFEKSRIMAVASYMGIRRGAQIIGDHVYTAEERMRFLHYDDVIGMASRKTKKAYEVPYSLMLPKGGENLLVASGKTVSCDDFLPYRVKPVCMILGQAAGTAAALCAGKGRTPRTLPIRLLQRQLIRDGVYLGEPDRLAELGLGSPESELAEAVSD